MRCFTATALCSGSYCPWTPNSQSRIRPFNPIPHKNPRNFLKVSVEDSGHKSTTQPTQVCRVAEGLESDWVYTSGKSAGTWFLALVADLVSTARITSHLVPSRESFVSSQLLPPISLATASTWVLPFRSSQHMVATHSFQHTAAIHFFQHVASCAMACVLGFLQTGGSITITNSNHK